MNNIKLFFDKLKCALEFVFTSYGHEWIIIFQEKDSPGQVTMLYDDKANKNEMAKNIYTAYVDKDICVV